MRAVLLPPPMRGEYPERSEGGGGQSRARPNLPPPTRNPTHRAPTARVGGNVRRA